MTDPAAIRQRSTSLAVPRLCAGRTTAPPTRREFDDITQLAWALWPAVAALMRATDRTDFAIAMVGVAARETGLMRSGGRAFGRG